MTSIDPRLNRRTREYVVLPLSQPIRGVDGSEIREIPVPKDTTVAVGLLSSNQNKAVWGEDALEWRPERWLAPLPGAVQDAKIPGVYSNLWVPSGATPVMRFDGTHPACADAG